MKKRNLLIISIFFVCLVVGTLFAYAMYAINMGMYNSREPSQRYYFSYDIEVTGLSGRHVNGTTVIMVPIPASKEGKFLTPPPQREPDLTQSFMLRLKQEITRKSEPKLIGPYFENMTETLDNKRVARGKWVTFITETDKGYMLGFRTNETRLEDIDRGFDFVANYFDIFDPINNGSPILFPIENVSNVSSVPYGDYTKYISNPSYDTYVYLSDNLKGGENVSFFVYLNANNDPYEWPEEYRGGYNNLLAAKVNDTGYVKARAILGQEVPWGNDSLDVLSTQYFLDFYSDEAVENMNETPQYTEIA